MSLDVVDDIIINASQSAMGQRKPRILMSIVYVFSRLFSSFRAAGSVVVSFELVEDGNATRRVNQLKGRIENDALPMNYNGVDLLVSERRISMT